MAGFGKRRHGNAGSIGNGTSAAPHKSSKKTSSAPFSTSSNDHSQPQPHILLARGLSARYVGANMPLTALKPDEVERDLRHIEAFADACTAYSQQYYIYSNQGSVDANGVPLDAANGAARHRQPMMNVAMPTRIDPEEDQRLLKLRQTIEHCENQREILESQYLSLRAHYVYMSHVLVNLRDDVNKKVEWLQSMVRKRGRVVGLQRVKLQVLRDMLAALEYRREHGNHPLDDGEQPAILFKFWIELENELAKAEQDCNTGNGRIETWNASLVPDTPPGLPLRLSQLSSSADHASGFGTDGMFGSKPSSMCWLVDNLPKTKTASPPLATLKEEVAQLEAELSAERNKNKDLHNRITARRKRNDQIVTMLSLLRTETEAINMRHNIILDKATKPKTNEITIPTTAPIVKKNGTVTPYGDDEDGEINEPVAKRSANDEVERSIKRRRKI